MRPLHPEASPVYDEFARQLAGWRRRYAARPRRELVRLFLLALEREQLVSLAYREEVVRERLAGVDWPDDVRELARHALLWAWKDEEMHAVFIRGVLLRLGSAPLRLRAFAQQLAGTLGGWAAAVQQHVHWRKAPMSRALAGALAWSGRLAGKVPAAVRGELRRLSFRDFCRFNVDAERTAALCWARIVELAEAQGLPAGTVADFRRTYDDEERHRIVFETLAGMLDEGDRLLPGTTAALVAGRLRAAGEAFLPRAWRRATVAHPLAAGGRVFVARGGDAGEKRAVLRALLDQADLRGVIAACAKRAGRTPGALRAAVKPTFMLGYHRKDPSVIVDPELLDELARALHELGCEDVAVIEQRNIYDAFYARRSVREVAGYFGIASPHFRLVDASEEQVPHAYPRGLGQYTVARTWKEADLRIVFGKLRSHPVEMASLALGALEGLGGRCDEFLFPERQAHRETAAMMPLCDFPPDFALLDAYERAPDGLLGVMGCPRPKRPLRLYAGADALAVDMVAARHIGLHDARHSLMVKTACHWFGEPEQAIEVVGVDEPIAAWRGPYSDEISSLLSFMAFPVYVAGSGRGALFVPEMDEDAFPPLGRVSLPLKLARRALQAFLGLRHPRSTAA